MKHSFRKSTKFTLIGCTLFSVMLLTSSWKNASVNLMDDGDPIYGVTNLVNATYAAVDAETETYIPANRVYNRYDALALRDNLQKLHEANPTSLAINLALVKFHANAPNFSGGYMGSALQYAANIYQAK